ncbi:hypothetical protein E0K83_16425 [Gramella sp. BOM4]|nr:hypothetical protein [Christiangramia bathymodioli]
MKIAIYLLVFFSLFSHQFHPQEISATLLEEGTEKPVAFATIQFQENRGVVSNEEGFFKIPASADISEINISSIGYESKSLSLEQIKPVIYLKSATIALSGVFISDKNLEAEEVVERAIAAVPQNYDFEFRKKRFFLRRSYVDRVNEFKLDVEESTVEGLDQAFMDKIASQIPKYVDSYREYLGDLYGNYENQKVQLLKAANLENPLNEESVEDMVDRFEKILNENVTDGTFLKIKSGIFGAKVDSEELKEGFEESKISRNPETPEEIKEQEKKRLENARNSANRSIERLMENMFWQEDITLDVFEKTRKYEFTTEGFININNSIAYVVAFEPKRGADFKGKIYIDTEDFGIHRLDYENIKNLKSFSLLGISTQDHLYSGKMIFSKGENSKYAPRFIEHNSGSKAEVDRPLTLLVKEQKGFIFKRKLEEVDMEFKINTTNLVKTELVVYEDMKFTENEFEKISTGSDFDYKTFKEYDPEFWSGYNIIEPNAAIKEFTALETD